MYFKLDNQSNINRLIKKSADWFNPKNLLISSTNRFAKKQKSVHFT